jgi:hypothetical protein
VLGPVLVTVVPASTPKLAAVFRSTGASAACAETLTITKMATTINVTIATFRLTASVRRNPGSLGYVSSHVLITLADRCHPHVTGWKLHAEWLDK